MRALKNISLKAVLKALLWTVLCLIIILNISASLLSGLGVREALKYLPYTALNVQGGSMAPTMNKGDLIMIGRDPYDSLKEGDVVTFYMDGELVTHRIEAKVGDEYITKGMANGISDINRLSETDYCGKVAFKIPFVGNILQLLCESYAATALAVLIMLILCFAKPVMRKLEQASDEGAERGRVRCGLTRVLVFVTAISILFTTPYYTSAKYVGKVNRLEMAVAQPLYFTSNYLAEGAGNQYYIQGWSGKAYNFTLQIRNYANELLYNKEDIPVRYGIGTKICTTDGYSTDYEISITPPATATAAQNFEYPDTWTQKGVTPFAAYQIEGGEKARDDFSVTVIPKYGMEANEPLPVNTKIRFELYSTTEQGETYAIELLGIFEMQVAQDLDFIGDKDTEILDSMVTLNVKTNLISDGTDERVLLFSWNPTYLYLNEYESTAFNVITNNPSYFDKENGRFWMKVPAFANINLEFFKRDIELDTDGDGTPNLDPTTFDYSVSVDIVDSVGALPTVSE